MQTTSYLARASRLASLLGALTCANFTAAQQGSASQAPTAPTTPATDPSATFAWSDFDQDGLLDAAAVQADGSLSLLKNLGDGSFADVSTSVGVDVQNVSFVLFEDGNADGLPDLFVASQQQGGSQLLLNQAGSFQNATLGSGLEPLAGVLEAQWLDYDADGRLDLHVTSLGANTLFHALGTARFEPIDLPVAQPGQASAFTTASLGLLTESAAEHGAATLGATDVDVDHQTTIVAGAGSRTPLGGPAGTGGGTQNMSTIVPGWPQCARLITDDATGACMAASSTPTLGMLHPLSEDLNVSGTGFVGIGTSTPATKLDVSGNGMGHVARIKNTNSFGTSSMEFSTDTDAFRSAFGYANPLYSAPWAGHSYLIANSTDFVMATNNTERMRIKLGGNIGIGTTNPTEQLEIGTNFLPGDKYFAIRTAGGNQYKAGIKFSHFADDNGFVIESDETFPVNGLNFIHQASGAASSAMYISRVTGDIGMGTTAPTDNLHLASAGPAIIRLEADTDNSDENDHAGIEFSQDNGLETGYVGFNNGNNEFKVQSATNDIDFDTDGVNRMRVTLGGNVGIGTGAPSQLLSVNGSAGKPGGGSWSNFSDRRLKKNIADLDGALDTLLELRGVTFEYKDPEAINELAGERIGFIAQEVETVLPDWVEDAGDYKMLTIRGFEALAVEALRELRGEVASKDAEIDGLRAEVERLRSVTERVEALESALHDVLATR